MKRTKKLAFSAILAALGTTILYLGAITGVLDISAVVLASFCVLFADIELKSPYQIMIYVVTSVLSFLILPDKETALLYILLGGYYPVIKAKIEKIRVPVVSYALKLCIFAVAYTATAWLTYRFFMLPEEITRLTSGRWLIIIISGAALVLFILYDFLLTRLTEFYFCRMRGRISHLLK